MKVYLILFLVLIVVAETSAQCAGENRKDSKAANMTEGIVEFGELPDGVKLDDEVRVERRDDEGNVVSFETITVGEKLKRMGARYADGVLVDKDGTAIRFYKPLVRGTSAGLEKDREFAKSEADRLSELKKKYTVVVIYVNPLKVM